MASSEKTIAVLIILLSAISLNTNAQTVWLNPSNPTMDEEVTLTYNTNSGNKGLADCEGDVYLHTGVITDKSIDGGDWKHVIGNWGEADNNTKMTDIGNGLYEFTFVINDFYGLYDDETAEQLAFVFRNENGTKVGKTDKSDNILIPVNGFIPPVPEGKSYKYESRQYKSYLKHGDTVDILTTNGITRIIPYCSNIIEVKHFTTSIIRNDSSSAVIMKPKKTFTRVEENDNYLSILTDSITVIASKEPFHLMFIYGNDTILEEEKGLYERTDNDGLRFKITENEKIYGMGERAIDLDLVGGRYNMYNRPQYGYELGARNLNYSVPVIVSSNKYMLLFDNPEKGYADIGETEQGIFEWGAIGGLMKYFVITGDDYKTIATNYDKLTGFQPMPPLWALGNLQSRMGYRNQEETDSIVNLMQREDFPLDAIILDFYWFGDSIKGTMGRLKWYKPAWPDPEQMISGLRKKGVKTILITEPYILDSLKNFNITDSLGILATNDKGESYVNNEFYFGHGALIDIFKPAAGDWFWKQYKKQMNIGVAGWWGDLGEPENHPSDQIHVAGKADEVHNIYGHYWHKALYNHFRDDYPKMRLFNLNRAGFAGSQRYSIYPWTGDVSRTWGGLQAQIPLMIHMSLSGLPFIHSDAGGFALGIKDNELYTRWLQMSCFSPILRPHGSVIPSEPVYFNDTTKTIVRNFIKQRYSLLPYIYTTAQEAAVNGYPVVRPLFFEFPDDTNSYTAANEYMFGPSILVSPVVEPGITTQDVYLPNGVCWYNWWCNIKESGGSNISYMLSLETIPLFIKGGSFIPVTNPVNSTDYYSTDFLKIKYYNSTSKTDTYTMFEDDGHTFGTIDNSEYQTLCFTKEAFSNDTDIITIVVDGSYPGAPDNRDICLELIGYDNSKDLRIFINGTKYKKSDSKDKSGYYYDDITTSWKIWFNLKSRNTEIKIKH